MSAPRYTYATSMSCDVASANPDQDEIEVEVSYTVVWGAPETPPSYSHGGLPADPDEIDDVRVETIGGNPGPFAQEVTAAILQHIAQNDTYAMLIEAADEEHQRAWADSEDRDDY